MVLIQQGSIVKQRSVVEGGVPTEIVDQTHGYRMLGDFQVEFKHEVPREKRVGMVNGSEVRVSFTARRHNIPTPAAKVRID